MQKIIGVTDLQRNFRSIFDDVARDNSQYVLTRGSRPEAALISYGEYVRLQRLQESDLYRRVDEMMIRLAERNATYTVEEVEADVEAAIQAVRAEKDS